MPGPVLFGFVLDHSCLLWQQQTCESTGTCLYFDNHQMSWFMLAVCVACKTLNVVFGLLAWCSYRWRTSQGQPMTSAEDIMAVCRTLDLNRSLDDRVSIMNQFQSSIMSAADQIPESLYTEESELDAQIKGTLSLAWPVAQPGITSKTSLQPKRLPVWRVSRVKTTSQNLVEKNNFLEFQWGQVDPYEVVSGLDKFEHV